MAISRPQRYHTRGLSWQITGTPGVRQTRIRLLGQGRFDLGVRRLAARDLVLRLRRNSPVDTGAMRQSERNEGDAAIIGPRRRPGDRSKFYALPANRRSRRPGYIERSINQTTNHVLKYERQQRAADRDMFDLATVLTRGRRV